MLKVGLIGCGGIGRSHANAYSKMDDVELVAFIDFNQELANQFVADFGGKAYKTLDEALEEVELDLVSIVTPPSAHYGLLLQTIEKGIPTFCEKPITTDPAQAKDIMEKAKASGVPIGIGFKMRYEAVFSKAKELIGKIGDIYSVSAVKVQPYVEGVSKAWIKDTGCMYELSVHDYDLINYIGGLKPESVLADLDYSWNWSRENRACLNVTYEGGVKGMLVSAYSPEITFTFGDITIIYVGSKGYLKIERPDRITVHTKETEVYDVEPYEGSAPFEMEIRTFVDGVKEGKLAGPNYEDGVINTLLIEAAGKSHREGRRVTLAEM